MDASGYITLSRQSGLMRELEVVAHNIANQSTTGFRRESVIFAEHVNAAGQAPSVSMALAKARLIDLTEGGLTTTGGVWDMAIRGDGFFQIETPDGPRLTRAGGFTPSADGVLVTPDGHRVLDSGGAPIAVPPNARQIAIGPDGTISADGATVGQVGIWLPQDPNSLRHQAGVLFSADAILPAQGATVMQGMLEDSNVNPVVEITRMIAVQRAYEAGQGFLTRDDERSRSVIETLGRQA